MSNKELESLVALVTGSARGIGKEIALPLAGRGAAIAVVDVQKETAEATAQEISALGIEARAYACDVSAFEI